MSKTYFNISEQKTNVINFIKKHKNILSLDDGSNAITTEYLDKLKNANTNEFLSLLNVRLKFGSKYFIFSDNYDEKHRMIEIWLPKVLSKVESDTAIEIACSSKSLEDVIEDCYCNWYNMTPKRWKTFEAIFDFYYKPKTSSKKTTKKTAKKTTKKTSTKVVCMTLNDFKRFMNDIVFID